MVALPSQTNMRAMLSSAKSTDNSKAASQTGSNLSSEQDEIGSFSHIRRILQSDGVPKKASEVIVKSWKCSTKKQYHSYIAAWHKFCKGTDNPVNPSINTILSYLTVLYEKGLGYSSINTARSAISTFLNVCGKIDIHNNGRVSRFMKGVFNDRPALPKYKTTWDVGTVLSYLKGIEDISLMQLSCRLCVLFLLLSAQRCQTLHLVQIDDILLSDTSLIIHPNHVLKQTRPGSHLEPITFQSYDKDKKLCIVYTMEQYLDRTKHLRQGQNLIISTMRPFKAASKNTIGRWVKLVLSKAGVDRCFTTHSTRSAATSMAKLKGVPLQSIMRSAGWSNAKTFAKFYDKPLDTEKQSIQSAILGTVE